MHDKKYTGGSIDRDYMHDALSYCHDAINNFDREDSYYHLKLGQYLLDYKEDRQAVESFKMSIKTANVDTNYTWPFYLLVMTLFSLCERQNKDTDHQDLVTWVEEGCKRYKDKIQRNLITFLRKIWTVCNLLSMS